MVGLCLVEEYTAPLRYKRRRLRPRGIQPPTRMAPTQSRSMRCQAVYRQCGLKEGNIQPLLQSEYRFCLLLQGQSGFQHLQSIVQHVNEKYTA